jgi:putative ABC transport system substrate-binding protein
MRRREFITLLGGAAAAWPLAARAQQSERMRRIGVLQVAVADDPEMNRRLAAFQGELGRLGWVQGRNLRVETRWAGGDPERIRNAAAELVALAPDVLLVNGSSGMDAMQRATRTVPVVFVVVPDPVGAGYADSLARPLANSSTGLERNGWNCSRSFRRTSNAQASFEIPQ